MDRQSAFIMVKTKEDRDTLFKMGLQEAGHSVGQDVWYFLNSPIFKFDDIVSACPRAKYTNILHV